MGHLTTIAAATITVGAVIGCGPATRGPGLAQPQEEGTVSNVVYTFGEWRVRPGQEAAFIAAWKELGDVFAGLPHPPGTGTLIRSTSDPALFYSFGPWDRVEHVEAMRRSPEAEAALGRLLQLCTEATPGTFRLVAEAPPASARR